MVLDSYKVYVKNVSLTDDEMHTLLKQVVDDISAETRIFKALVGFTLEPTIEYYDFEAIFGLYNITVTDMSSINIGSPGMSIEDILDGKFPTIDVTTAVKYPEHKNMILDINGILDVKGKDASHKFQYLSGYNYLNKEYDPKPTTEPEHLAALISFTPSIDAIQEDVERRIKPAIIAGLKYFANDIYNDTDNAQVANLYYQRYFAAKRELINKYPVSTALGRRDSSKKYV